MRPPACHPQTQARKSGSRKGFRLTKWYMDVVSPTGHAAVAYWADLRWGLLHFAYSGFLESAPDHDGRSTSSTRRCEPPTFRDGCLTWNAPRLNIRGRWESAAPPFRCSLLSGPRGDVDWSCIHPRARASVSVGSSTIEGWGYAECLTLSIRPWRLPIHELLWGRFLSDDASIVWIEWRGPEPRVLILHDGREIQGAQIGADGLSWPGGRLALSAGRTLRQGAIGSTVLAKHGLLRTLTPRAVRALREHKSLSRGVLSLSGRPPSAGWAIHEIVHFRSPP